MFEKDEMKRGVILYKSFAAVILALGFVIALYFQSHEALIGQVSRFLAKTTDICPQNDLLDTRYVLMVDAGSAGSRIHIYKFDHQSSNPRVINEEFEYTIPGLSNYADNPAKAAESLEPLLDFALAKVPECYHEKTPISIKATAGLRLLGNKESSAIISAVSKNLEKYPFKLHDVGILDGKDEGVYAWLTVNYLLGTLKDNNKGTAAVFDLGGASAQIVFEPNLTVYSEEEAQHVLSHGDHRYDLNFGGNHHKLYQHSHLGYGLMEARKRLHITLAEEQVGRTRFWNRIKVEEGDTLVNPCIATGSEKYVDLDITPEGRKPQFVKVKMVGPEEAAPEECLRIAKQTLNMDKECVSGHCGFNGVHQPSLAETFDKEPLYVVSYFYDRIFPLGVPLSFKLEDLRELTNNVCQGRSAWQREYYSAIDALEERPEWCLDLSYMFTLLHDGYGVPIDREVTIGRKVDGYGLSWTLGAALQMLKVTVETPELELS